jgi:hypothetical protein
MAKPANRRWTCPLCGAGRHAPGKRPHAEDSRYFCFPCSESTGRLVRLVCPALERQRARKAETRKRREARKAEAARRRDERERAKRARAADQHAEHVRELVMPWAKLYRPLLQRAAQVDHETELEADFDSDVRLRVPTSHFCLDFEWGPYYSHAYANGSSGIRAHVGLDQAWLMVDLADAMARRLPSTTRRDRWWRSSFRRFLGFAMTRLVPSTDTTDTLPSISGGIYYTWQELHGAMLSATRLWMKHNAVVVGGKDRGSPPMRVDTLLHDLSAATDRRRRIAEQRVHTQQFGAEVDTYNIRETPQRLWSYHPLLCHAEAEAAGRDGESLPAQLWLMLADALLEHDGG